MSVSESKEFLNVIFLYFLCSISLIEAFLKHFSFNCDSSLCKFPFMSSINTNFHSVEILSLEIAKVHEENVKRIQIETKNSHVYVFEKSQINNKFSPRTKSQWRLAVFHISSLIFTFFQNVATPTYSIMNIPLQNSLPKDNKCFE